ncbi:MAG: protein kinase [Zavarzinella sp.]
MSNPNNEPVTETLTNRPIAPPQQLETHLGHTTESAHDAIPFAPPLAAGELGRLGKYRIIRELGHGGMGAVYQAHDEHLDRDVALKVMLPTAAKKEIAKTRFLREARAAAKIDSDYVVAIYEAAEIDGVPYISQQLLKGCPLDEYLVSKGSLSIPEIIRIGRDVARGLAKAHELGLIHRDIKPGNLWCEVPDGRIKILDFGLAKSFADNGPEVTSNGSILGTPAYMSVEQASGEQLDGRSDLFSLGAVLYRLVTGQTPFPGNHPGQVLKDLLIKEPTPILDLQPNIPPELANFIHRLLAKNPDQRPQTAQDVESELSQLLRFWEPLENRTVTSANITSTVLPLAGQATAVDSIANKPTVDMPSSVKKNTFFRILLFLVPLLIVVAGGYIIIKITNKDGTVTELKVDDQSKIEIDGRIVTPEPPKPEPKKLIRDYDPEYKWLAALPAEEQVKELSEELKRLNPGFDGKLEPTIEKNKVIYLKFFTMKVSNIAPLKAINSLVSLQMTGANAYDPGKLADISPLKGLKLEVLYIGSNPITDLSPLQGMPIKWLDLWACPYKDLMPLEGMPLTWLNLGGANQNPDLSLLKKLPLEFLGMNTSQVSDLEPLTSLPLKTLHCSNTKVQSLKPLENMKLQKLTLTNTLVADLSPIKELSLVFLECDGSKVTNLAPVKGMPLKTIRCNFNYQRDCQLLREIKTLEKINDRPAADFWKTMELSQLPPVEGPAADRRAAEWVLCHGGTVGIKNVGDIKAMIDLPKADFEITHIKMHWMRINDDELLILKNLKSLVSFQTQVALITDDGLAHLKNITSLKEITLLGSIVTDVGLAQLKGLPNLEWLNVSGTKVGDAGLEYLKEIPSLQAIQMEATPVTDEGLVHIKDFNNLGLLFLGSTRVSDEGLVHLKDCKKLKHLDLNHTKVTAEGVKTFAAAMPQCRIISDFGVFEPKIK